MVGDAFPLTLQLMLTSPTRITDVARDFPLVDVVGVDLVPVQVKYVQTTESCPKDVHHQFPGTTARDLPDNCR